MNNLLKRSLSGAVLVAVMVGAILCSPITLVLLALVVVVGSLTEFFRLSALRGRMRWTTVGWGLLWIVAPMSLLPLLGLLGGGYHPMRVLFYVILIWINDIGAYLVGSTLGKHRLCERISPKKSWEGFFGGLLFTVLAAVWLGPRMGEVAETLPLWSWIGFGAIVTVTAVVGDLLESAFKRWAGVKDSGTIIPGHGGFLDRFDAMFLSLPFVYALALIVIIK
jgi:phosphatidate cytidylyltransferase